MNTQDFKNENQVLIKYLGNKTDIIIPDSVRKIQKMAFSECPFLESVIIPDSVEEIGKSAFYACSYLRKVILPAHLNYIPECMFLECHSLSEITIPEQVICIGDSAFMGCSGLTSVILPEHLETIEGCAFFDTGLRKIRIPDSVTTIGKIALYSQNIEKIIRWGIEISIDSASKADQYLHLADDLKIFLENPEQNQISQQLKEAITFLLCIDDEHFKICLESGKVFEKNNIDSCIRYANQRQFYQKQILLMDYKYQHFDFNQTGENLKL